MLDPKLLVNSLNALKQRLSMQDFVGEFETHLTFSPSSVQQIDALARWGQQREMKCVFIQLERGTSASQPMLTRHSKGTLASEVRKAYELAFEGEQEGFACCRVKLEVAPSNPGVPQNSSEAQTQPDQRYFEHHIKLLISPDMKSLEESSSPAETLRNSEVLQAIKEQHNARFSRNARRIRADGLQERFVTQRCYDVGRVEAHAAFERLIEDLKTLPFPILETEEEYVVFDNNIALDTGWLQEIPETMNDYPNTLRTLNPETQPERPRVFEPSLKQYSRAFSLGEPQSSTYHERLEHERLRAEVRAHLLQLIANSRWKDHLVLRGSVLLHAWFGPNAREPKDIDWVFQPQNVKLGSVPCEEFFAEIVVLVRQNPNTANARILVDKIASDDIWTYERADGRRIVFPYQGQGTLQREIQMDVVFGEALEELYEPPVLTSIALPEGDAIELWAATPELSLAWKLLWLLGDAYPQGKDLYDATLLAENVRLPKYLLREVLDGDEWCKQQEITPQLFSSPNVDWDNFLLSFPWAQGTAEQWKQRLVRALTPTFQEA